LLPGIGKKAAGFRLREEENVKNGEKKRIRGFQWSAFGEPVQKRCQGNVKLGKKKRMIFQAQ